MKTVAIIPARMASTRFPNKPLTKICGVPMIGHIYHRVSMCKEFDTVYVATCDQEIVDYVESIGGKAVMTADTHERATDRTAEALFKIEEAHGKKFDVVAMVQGDEPLVDPAVLSRFVHEMEQNRDIPILNLMVAIQSDEEWESANTVKVVTDPNGFALYFSREPIPSKTKWKGPIDRKKQTGLIFFRRQDLIRFNEMRPTTLEQIESCDMLRVIEHGEKIKMIMTEEPALGVDVPSDVPKVEPYMSKDPLFAKYKDKHI